MHPLSLLAQDDGGSSGGGVIQLLILLMIPVAMYLLLIRPQRKRVRDQAAMQSSIEIGDEVVTNSGIYGFVTGVDDDRFWLEIDDDVQIRIAKAAVQGKVDTSGAVAADDEPDGDDQPAGEPADDADES